MKTSHSLIPSFLFFGFYSKSKKGRELGSHPVNVNKVKWMTVTFGFYWDESLRSVRSDVFSSWMLAGSKSCHCQELSGTGSAVIPRWDLQSLQPWQSFQSSFSLSCLKSGAAVGGKSQCISFMNRNTPFKGLSHCINTETIYSSSLCSCLEDVKGQTRAQRRDV